MASILVVLYIVAFLGYSVQYILMNNLNIAMTSMMYNPLKTRINTEEEMVFYWNEFQQGIILGSVFYLLWLSHLIGGIMSQNFSTKKVMGYALFLGSIINIILPIAARHHYILLSLLRTLQGFCIGSAFPCIFSIVPNWIPPYHRGKFLTCFLGISFGSGITYFISGLVIKHFGWEAVFYVNGILGLMWCFAWKYLMYDKPEQHPRLSDEDKAIILKSLPGNDLLEEKIPIPWSSILKSRVVLSNILNQFGVMWTIYFVTIYSPRYLSFFHHLSPETTGYLTSLPHLFRVVVSLLFATLADYLISTEKMSSTGVRKLANFISHILVGVLLIGLIFLGEILLLAEIIIILILALSGTATTGAVAGVFDCSPKFGSVVQGLVGVVSNTAGVIVPTLVGYMTLNNDTIEQWQKIFLIGAIISLVTGLQFMWLWDSKLQEWNFGTKTNRIHKNIPLSEMDKN